jgi:hypothetical protein
MCFLSLENVKCKQQRKNFKLIKVIKINPQAYHNVKELLLNQSEVVRPRRLLSRVDFCFLLVEQIEIQTELPGRPM